MELNLFPLKDKYIFLSLASGSSGNCYFLGKSSSGILIDAGIGLRTIKKSLREHGIALQNIMAVLVTHDHADHIRTVGCLGEKLHIPIYATKATHEAINRSHYVQDKLQASQKVIEKESMFSLHGFDVTAFEVPHDSFDNVGYHINFGGHSLTLATDVGRITDRIEYFSKKAELLVIESNYDEEMLQNGSYPAYLKKRITCGTGHLSNREAADFVVKVYSEQLADIWLCHLSNDNNHPELAYKTVEQNLYQAGIRVGIDVMLQALNRGKPSKSKEFIPTGKSNAVSSKIEENVSSYIPH
jgi:phosphoribosyl 1,2-cyclic phosphodiesterase